MKLINHKGATRESVAPRARGAARSPTQDGACSGLMGTGAGSLLSHPVPTQERQIPASPNPSYISHYVNSERTSISG